MLVLSRKKGESIILDGNIEVTVLEVGSDGIKLGIEAPKEVEIFRKELYLSIQQTNKESSQPTVNLSELSKELKDLGGI